MKKVDEKVNVFAGRRPYTPEGKDCDLSLCYMLCLVLHTESFTQCLAQDDV